MKKLEFIKKSGFIIGVIVLLMAVMPMSDGLVVQAQPSLEYGDAPDPTYPSLAASGGVCHWPTETEILGLFSMGDLKDWEIDAWVPDMDMFDDGLNTFFIGAGNPAATVSFEVTNWMGSDLFVNILIDLNQDGDWNDAGEHVVQNQLIFLPAVSEGIFVSNPFSTMGATPGPTWLRLTLTRVPIGTPWDGTVPGPFEYGETEDHEIFIEPGKEDDWYWKPGNWTDYALSGMPDFDQKQDGWNFVGQWTYCGPVAVANSLWWFDSREETGGIPPPTSSDSYGLVTNFSNPWDDHNVTNVEPLVNNLSLLMGTGPFGTDVFAMQHGIREYLNATGYADDYYEHTEIMPEFEWIEAEVERCQDVILLLGFWWWDGDWYRIGGHYVTCAGVNSNTSQIAISDPFLDNAELGFPGRVLPPVPPHPPAGHNANVHNDTWYVSHDIYNVTYSDSPGGIWKLEGYADGKELDINYNFQGQNGECFGPPYEFGPIFTEIEYAVAVSPTGATLVGNVTFPGARVGSLVEPFEVKLFEPGNFSNVIWSGNRTTNSSGMFNITGLTPDTYDIGIKSAICVSEVNFSVTLSPGTNVVDFTIRSGDCDDNDYVDMGDYSAFSSAFNTAPMDPKWDAGADLDRNSWVDMGDYSMFSSYFNELGDAYGHF